VFIRVNPWLINGVVGRVLNNIILFFVFSVVKNGEVGGKITRLKI
jgi:hypothetical protein